MTTTPARLWRAARAPLIIALLVVLAAVAVAAAADRGTRGLLDPNAVDDAGSRAVAALLREQGVTVDLADASADLAGAGPGATVLVPFAGRLGPAQLRAVQDSDADLVLVAPGPEALAALAPTVEITALRAPVEVREPGCALRAATVAGPVELGGELYRSAVGCFPSDEGAALVQVTDRGRTVTVLGAPDVLTNGALAHEGNAALALALLGPNPRLLWFRPGPEGPPVGDERSLFDLLAPGWGWGALQLGVAALLAVLWRARRLGPVVAEPLPVVVRSAEAVEGRARLYRRTRASGHAAEVLRGATRARLAPLVGLPDTTLPAALVDSVAARTRRAPVEVGALLYGPAPVDDAALIRLADSLDACETEVRRS